MKPEHSSGLLVSCRRLGPFGRPPLLHMPLVTSLSHADPEGACHRALNFSRGFAPEARVSSYLKLLPMLAGIGSPGTLQEVWIPGYSAPEHLADSVVFICTRKLCLQPCMRTCHGGA